jgi:hypothetical protein
MARVDKLFTAGIKSLPAKPPDGAAAGTKKNWTEKVSNVVAHACAEELRARNLKGALPAPPGTVGASGAERRMSGGIGAKQVDVTWATEESGLLLAISVKSIMFVTKSTRTYQKNLTNRRGDMLFESVTLHRRFPYAVLGGFFVLDQGAAADATARRRSTFENAHQRFALFTGRNDPAGRDEQYERLWIILLDANVFSPSFKVYAVSDYTTPVSLQSAFDELIALVPARNPDFYENAGGNLRKLR